MIARFKVYSSESSAFGNFAKIYVVQLDDIEVVKYRLLGKRIRIKAISSRLVKRYCIIGETVRWQRMRGGIRHSRYRFDEMYWVALDLVDKLNNGISSENLSWVERKKGKIKCKTI